ncbi:MAG: alpha-galactosidase [Clostridia bacterium]|nr:alpha-galactosidase [Clostridia bacterium]
MKNNFQADFSRRADTLPAGSPADVPLTLKIGEEILCGIPACCSPTVTRRAADASVVLRVFEGRHPSGLILRAEATEYRDFPVTEWVVYLTNPTDHDSPIVSDLRLTGVIPGEGAVLTHSNGDTCHEDGYEVYHTPVTETVSLTPADGTSCNGAFPYMRLSTPEGGVNLAVGWTGMWLAEFSPAENGTRFSVGQRRCHTKLLPGETIRTPSLTLMAYAGDENHGMNLWRRWYLAHVLPRENGAPLPPKLCLHVWNVDGPEFTGATEEKQLLGLRTYIERGMKPDIWWFDAGWYPCDHDWPHTGTWEHDTARFPNGLGPVGKACDDNGVQFLLWFEPERVRADTWLWDNHPEWLLKREGDENALLDLGCREACDWLIGHVDEKIKDYHIRIYRQDFNFNPRPFWEEHEAEDRIGALENLHIQGYLRYWDALLDRNPGLWMDSCASGGRRNDIETMRRAVPLHYTDVGYGDHPIKQKQHRLMFEWIPYFRAHNMSWDDEEGNYGSGYHPVDRFAFHCAMAPALTNMTTYDGPEEEYAAAAEMLPIWRRAAELELRGDYYPLTECKKDNRDWYVMQFDDPATGDGFVQLIRNTHTESDTFMLYMHVEDPEAEYFFENMENGDMMQLSGEQLKAGIPLTVENPRQGIVWFYHTVSF